MSLMTNFTIHYFQGRVGDGQMKRVTMSLFSTVGMTTRRLIPRIGLLLRRNNFYNFVMCTREPLPEGVRKSESPEMIDDEFHFTAESFFGQRGKCLKNIAPQIKGRSKRLCGVERL